MSHLSGVYQELVISISLSQGDKLHFGATDADFIGVGGSIFLTITLLMFTVSNLIGHLPPTLLEVKTSPSHSSEFSVNLMLVLC